MDICTFNDHYLNPLLDNLFKEANEANVLLGDFLDNLTSNSLQPQILLLRRISNNSKTLTDNIFCNIPTPLIKSAMSGNISSSLLDYLPQFFMLTHFFSNSPPTKYNILFHDWENFNNW